MSRGPGHIERAIKQAFEAEPDRVFTTEELCSCVFDISSKKIEKKHRVSLVRAAKRLLKREGGWHMTRINLPGRPFLFYKESVLEDHVVPQDH